jgi:hypothetical protein
MFCCPWQQNNQKPSRVERKKERNHHSFLEEIKRVAPHGNILSRYYQKRKLEVERQYKKAITEEEDLNLDLNESKVVVRHCPSSS